MTDWFESTLRFRAVRARQLGGGLAIGVGTLLSLPACGTDDKSPVSSRQLPLDEQSYYYGLGDKRVALSFQPDRVGLVTVEKVGRVQVNAVAAAFGLKLQTEL